MTGVPSCAPPLSRAAEPSGNGRAAPVSGRSLNFERRHFRRIGAGRMPEADRSAAAQKDLLALHRHFSLTLKRYEGAVGTDVDQNEFVAAALDPCVLARRFAVRYDDVAGVLPAELY